MKRVLLIDGDMLAYKYAAASEHAIDWGEGVTTLSANFEPAAANLDAEIESFLRQFKASDYVVALSDPKENFRKDIDDTYKSNRKEVRQPIIRRLLEGHLENTHGAKWKPRLEGDDVLGILATNRKMYPGTEKIIVSNDKDMMTIPGTLYRLEKLQKITDVEADYYHLFQTLTGDRTDGYLGCPNVGPIKAAKLLDTTVWEDGGKSAIEYPRWPAVVKAYEKAGLTANDALCQARLARILRHEDYDYKRKEPRLWEPKS